MIAELAAAVDPLLGVRIAAWSAPGGQAPNPAFVATLHQMVEAQEPWAPALITWVLESEPHQWDRRQWQVRRLRKIWHQGCQAQSQADWLMALESSSQWMTRWDRNLSIRVGYALDRALTAGRTSAELRRVAHALLPGRYLTSSGWNNLRHLPDAVVALLVTRSGSGENMNPRYKEVAYWLYGQRDPWMAATCGCIVAAMMGERGSRGNERNAPRTIRETVIMLLPLLKSFRQYERSGRNVETLLANHIHGRSENTKRCMTSTRVQHVRLYIVAATAQNRLIANEPYLAPILAPWLLPPLTTALDVEALLEKARLDQKARRKRRLDALMPRVLTLLTVNECRAVTFQALYTASKDARRHFEDGGRTPLQYEVRLPDHSATLMFRIATVALLDQEAREKGIAIPDRPAQSTQVLTEYLGAYDRQGQTLAEPFFAALHAAWYDATARQNLIHAGHRVVDFYIGTSGLMRPRGGLQTHCRVHAEQARAAGLSPALLFDMGALSAGVAYGTLYVMLTFATGMRIHEIQQLRLDAEFSDLSDGCFSFLVYPKYGKREPKAPVTHRVPTRLNPYIMEVIQLRQELWPGWTHLHPPHAAEMGYESGLYLFSTGTTCLRQPSLLGLGRHTSLGVDVNGFDGAMQSLTSHDLRYANSLAHLDMRTPLDVIQSGLGHRTIQTTMHYTFGQLPGTTQYLQTTAQPLSLWQALQAQLPEGL